MGLKNIVTAASKAAKVAGAAYSEGQAEAKVNAKVDRSRTDEANQPRNIALIESHLKSIKGSLNLITIIVVIIVGIGILSALTRH